jgi:hypothetical protein
VAFSGICTSTLGTVARSTMIQERTNAVRTLKEESGFLLL